MTVAVASSVSIRRSGLQLAGSIFIKFLLNYFYNTSFGLLQSPQEEMNQDYTNWITAEYPLPSRVLWQFTDTSDNKLPRQLRLLKLSTAAAEDLSGLMKTDCFVNNQFQSSVSYGTHVEILTPGSKRGDYCAQSTVLLWRSRTMQTTSDSIWKKEARCFPTTKGMGDWFLCRNIWRSKGICSRWKIAIAYDSLLL